MTRWWSVLAVALAAGLVSMLVVLVGTRTAAPSRDSATEALGADPKGLREQDRRRGDGTLRPESKGAGLPPSAPGAAEPREPSPREVALAREVAQLRRREGQTQAELTLAKQQLARLQEQARQGSDPRAFDLSPDDWRRLGRQGTLKLRVPCPVSSTGDLSPTQLDYLGLAPEDGPFVAAAFQHSAERVWATLGPLCAQALGGSAEQAAAQGPGPCRHLILNDAAQKGTALGAFQRAAAYLAGDADEPVEQGAVEKLVLQLSQEQRLIEAELAEHFGPEEADDLVFSHGLCFTEATHQLGGAR